MKKIIYKGEEALRFGRSTSNIIVCIISYILSFFLICASLLCIMLFVKIKPLFLILLLFGLVIFPLFISLPILFRTMIITKKRVKISPKSEFILDGDINIFIYEKIMPIQGQVSRNLTFVAFFKITNNQSPIQKGEFQVLNSHSYIGLLNAAKERTNNTTKTTLTLENIKNNIFELTNKKAIYLGQIGFHENIYKKVSEYIENQSTQKALETIKCLNCGADKIKDKFCEFCGKI